MARKVLGFPEFRSGFFQFQPTRTSKLPFTYVQFIPSHLTYADRAARKFLEFWHRHYSSHQHDVALRLSLVEAITNAIEHGNRQQIQKLVVFRAQIGRNRILLKILDEGPGFQPQDRTNLEEINVQLRSRGRGLHIIQHLMDRVWFNKGGRQINMVKMIPSHFRWKNKRK